MVKPDKETLKKLYWGEGLTLRQVGKRLGVYSSTIRHWMIDYDIPRRKYSDYPPPVPKGSRLSESHRKAISEAQKRLVVEGKRRYDGEHRPAWKGGPLTVNCGWCGESLQVPRCRLKYQENFFCKGTDCRSKWFSVIVKQRRYDKPHYGSQELICDNCGETFRRQNHQIKDQEHCFCSTECCREWQSGEILQLTCENCGNDFQRPAYRFKGQEHVFCSPECKKTFMRGDKIYNYKGSYEPYYGPNWREQRVKARERDGHICQECGKPEAELDRKLDVHHIAPFREFGLKNYIQANDLSNLISLCAPCHSTLHRKQG